MKTSTFVLATGLVLAVTGAQAQPEPNKSLSQARLEIIKGTSPGIVLIGARPSAPDAGAPAAPPADAKPATVAATANKVAPAASAPAPTSIAGRVGEWLKFGQPPSGIPLGAMKRGDSPTQGIQVPTAQSSDTKRADERKPKP